MMTAREVAPMLPQIAAKLGDQRWFSGGGCVIERGADVEVSVFGVLIGRYRRDDIGARNAVLVGLAQDPKMNLRNLAAAFGISDEMLRLIRRKFEQEGLAAVATPGTAVKLGPDETAQVESLFDEGLSVSEAHERVGKEFGVSRATVGVIRRAWGAREEAPVEAPLVATRDATDETSATPPPEPPVEASTNERPPEEPSAKEPPVEPGKDAEFVQHAGSWLLVGGLERYGLYDVALDVARRASVDGEKARLAIDSAAIALALGEPTIEGVRRLATPSAGALLRADHAPSADWVRRTLAGLAPEAVRFHLGMAGRLVEAARSATRPAVFYIDNHLRPYTGKHTLRLGWRMQEKAAVEGTSDYYVHDEDGRPVLRFVSASHAPLTDVLPDLGGLMRAALGDDQRILFAFDRAGAFADNFVFLRDENFEFVTYERKPYRELKDREFTNEAQILDEQVRYREMRVALGKGRGDIRRIAMKFPNEHQVNLVAMSSEPATSLMEILRLRWRQENAFKHGVERWGINQLDGRRVIMVPAGTIIPNPARRRLENGLKLAHTHEGEARNRLARREEHDPDYDMQLANICDALETENELLDERPKTPTHAPIEETDLFGKLVEHDKSYKTIVDTIRIGCANVEADLAAALAPHLPRRAEAKRTLANLFAAPGRISIDEKSVRLVLQPAGTGPEREAFAALCAHVTAEKLTLPGALRGRPLRVQAQA